MFIKLTVEKSGRINQLFADKILSKVYNKKDSYNGCTYDMYQQCNERLNNMINSVDKSLEEQYDRMKEGAWIRMNDCGLRKQQRNAMIMSNTESRQAWVKTQWLMDFNFPHFTSIQIMICNEILFCGFPFILFITPLCRDWSLARFEIKSKHIFIIKSIFSQPVTFKISKYVNLSNILFRGKRKIIQFHLLRKDAVAAVYMYTKSIC